MFFPMPSGPGRAKQTAKLIVSVCYRATSTESVRGFSIACGVVVLVL